MRTSHLQLAKEEIQRYFSSLDQHVFKLREIEKHISAQRGLWKLTPGTTAQDCIEFFMDEGDLRREAIRFPQRTETRYIWRKASDYQVIQSLRSKGYFTHFTALAIHGLTLQQPKVVYFNVEQPSKPRAQATLSQERVDFAFSRSCRVSKSVGQLGGLRIHLLNGKQTHQTGVIDYDTGEQSVIRVTDIERSLIDATVRPIYSGGVHVVLEAYRRAGERVSVNKMAATLSALDYVYPYHQTVGFYLERSGLYTERQLALMDRFERKLDFYLDYQMKEKDYSPRWRIFYPKGL